MNGDILDRIFIPVDESGDDERVHVWVGAIALLLIVFLFGIRVSFGKRAI